MEPEGPDIVVTTNGRRRIAVEVKVAGDVDRAVDQMTTYMDRLLYPVGLVVVGRMLVLLRRDFATGRIETVGRFDTTGVQALTPPQGGWEAHDAFADRVQRWLESLRESHGRNEMPEPMSSAIIEWAVPEVEAGDVRATGPRHQIARAG